MLAGSSVAYAANPDSVIASADDGNVAANTLDIDFDTRWSAEGNDGSQWIQYDFGSSTSISAVDIAFYKGEQRNTYFQVQSSDDASTWTTLLGGTITSSGDTDAYETFDFANDVSARYFRIVGFGNSSNDWNSITEVSFTAGEVATSYSTFSDSASAAPNSVLASSDDGNVAANTLDDDPTFSTRWSAQGNDGSQWIRYDFGASTTLSAMDIAFYKGDQRNSYFQLQSSDDASDWTTLLGGTLTSSGNSTSHETFAFDSNVSARYFRIVGLGNSANTWNSITDVAFTLGEAEDADDQQDSDTSVAELTVTASSDDGNVAANTIDDDPSFSTRWSAQGDDGSQWIQYDFGETTSLNNIAIAFYKGDQRSSYFQIQSSDDANTWTDLFDGSLSSSGDTVSNQVFAFDDTVSARYFRIVGFGNSSNDWNSITDVVFDSSASADDSSDNGESDPVDSGDGDDQTLNPSLAPGQNFDLSDWYVSVPTDEDDSGTADSIKGDDLTTYQDEFFFTGEDGGMVFKCPVDGYKTSTSTAYTRVELREMVEGGDNTTTKDLRNNWAFSTNEDQDFLDEVGAIDGVLTATLAVNHVTTTGSSSKRGRVIIGQIHAPDDEPIRLYYHKTPDNENGAIYFAHEPESSTGLDEEYIYLYGDSRSSSMDNPEDGVPLGEVFSYKIQVVGNMLSVTVYRDGHDDAYGEYNMEDSGYNESGQYMYFKAGLYNQHSVDYGADEDDYAQVTFYALENTHTIYNLD